MLASYFKENRIRINKEIGDINKRKDFSPLLYSLHGKISSAIKVYARGTVLDAGCGDMPYKIALTDAAGSYRSLDRKPRTEGVDFIGDIQDMCMIGKRSFDTVFCCEVLEHVPSPEKAVAEIARVLKSRGTLILSVPHLSRIHEAPYDYYRFTEYGLRYLLEENNFTIRELQVTGSVLSFLGHQWSTFIVCLFWRIPLIKWLVFFINKWLCVVPCYYIDQHIFKGTLTPLEYVCVAQMKD